MRKRKPEWNKNFNSKITASIEEVIDQVSTNIFAFKKTLSKSDTLGIINRAKVNTFLNVYVGRILQSTGEAQKLSDKIVKKIWRTKTEIPSDELTRMYIKTKELENEQLKLVMEFTKLSNLKLDVEEQNMIIIYRSLPEELKNFMYDTVMEFVRKCPAIQKELQKLKENAQVNQQ